MDFKDLDKPKDAAAPTMETSPPESGQESKRAYAAVIQSKLLNEKIVVLKDRDKLDDIRAEYPGLVIYSPREIEILSKFKDDPAVIKKIHFAKKTFEGWIY